MKQDETGSSKFKDFGTFWGWLQCDSHAPGHLHVLGRFAQWHPFEFQGVLSIDVHGFVA